MTEQDKQEIIDIVTKMIEASITLHTHNGSDSAQIQGQYLSQAPQPTVNAPSGGTVVDIEGRTAISDLISRLQRLGLIN